MTSEFVVSETVALPLTTLPFFIATGKLPDRIPAAEIGPGDRGGNDGRVRGLLHHGIVDRDARALGKALGVEAGEIEIALGVVDRLFDSGKTSGANAWSSEIIWPAEKTNMPEFQA